MSNGNKPLDANENEGIFFPRVKNNTIEKMEGAVNINGIVFDATLTPATGRNTGKTFWQLSGTCRDGDHTVSGSVFEREKVGRRPDMSGPIELNKGRADVQERELSLWLRKPKKEGGNQFFSGTVGDRFVKGAATSSTP